MPTRTNRPDSYAWRRLQLDNMDANPNLIDRIVDTPIKTAESILNLATHNPKAVSLVLRGTAAKQIQNAMGAIAGYKKAPLRKMRAIIQELCPGAPYQVPYYPHAELPPKNIIEEIETLATEVVDLLAYLKTHEANEISHRMLKLIEKYDCLSNDLKRQVTILAKFDPTYRPPPNFSAQFQEHKSLSEQLEQMNKDHRYAQALKLFTTPPKGHA